MWEKKIKRQFYKKIIEGLKKFVFILLKMEITCGIFTLK